MGLAEDLNSDPIKMKNPVVKYIILIDLAEIALTVFLGIFSTPFKLNYFWKMLTSFGKIERALPFQSSSNKRSLWKTALFLIFALCVIIFDLVLWGSSAQNLGLFLKRFGPVYVSYFLIFVQQILFCVFARLIRVKIEDLNGVFRSGLEQNGENQWISVMKVKQKVYKNALTYERLNDFMRLIEEIEDVIEAINDFFGVHTLVNFQKKFF